ncbi:MAG: hypothetical protein RIS76_1515 [Verrucomicrobiota bacterium]|jgi:hypothetical protein
MPITAIGDTGRAGLLTVDDFDAVPHGGANARLAAYIIRGLTSGRR